jgi:hypothetical protein
VFALTLSPVAVRGAADSPSAIIPGATDVVSIRLEGEAGGPRLKPSRATIRTVAGQLAWQGPVGAAPASPRGILGQVEVPAGSLPAEDYLLTLFGADPAGVEREWTQYFLRVRAR